MKNLQRNLKKVITNKAFSEFAEILKHFSEIEIAQEDGYIFAKGETKKYKKILQACSFI